jgi:hypothetical protein
MITEIVYLDRDNTNDLLLKADGAAVDLSAVTRMVIADVAGAWSVDSDTSPAAFDWTTGTTGKVVLAFGHEGIPAGTYICNLIVYDPDNDNGIHWRRISIIAQK